MESPSPSLRGGGRRVRPPLPRQLKSQPSPQIALSMLSKHTAGGVDIRSFLININTGVFQRAKLTKQRCLFSCSLIYSPSLEQAQLGGENRVNPAQEKALRAWLTWRLPVEAGGGGLSRASSWLAEVGDASAINCRTGLGAALCACMLSHFSHVQLFVTLWTVAWPWDFPGKNTGVGCHALLQGFFAAQGSNPPPLHLLHGRHVLYH